MSPSSAQFVVVFVVGFVVVDAVVDAVDAVFVVVVVAFFIFRSPLIGKHLRE